jgi:hypothetical protein
MITVIRILVVIAAVFILCHLRGIKNILSEGTAHISEVK